MNKEDNKYNREERQTEFVTLIRRAALFEDFARKAERVTLRHFAVGCSRNPIGAYCSYVSTRAEFGELASRIRKYFNEATAAAAQELLSYQDVTPEMIREVLEPQNLEDAGDNRMLREDLQ